MAGSPPGRCGFGRLGVRCRFAHQHHRHLNDAANSIAAGSAGGLRDHDRDPVARVPPPSVAGNNVDVTYNDTANTITIDVETLTKTDVGLGDVDNTSDAADR